MRVTDQEKQAALDTPILEVWQRLGYDPPRSGENIRSPFREDQNASLQVGGQKNIIYDYGIGESWDTIALVQKVRECSFPEAVEWIIGRPPSRPSSRSNGQTKEIAATYPFTDESGGLLSEEVRYVPKDFKQRRPDGMGGYIWNVKDVRRVPYQLPKVIEAKENDEIILVVEGPKDVQAAESIDFAATCNAGGAGKWSDEHAKPFEGAKYVVAIPDNDLAGFKHSEKVARSLQGKVETVKVLKPLGSKSGYDLSDWINDGGTREALLALIDSSPPWKPTEESESADIDDEEGGPVKRRYPSQPITAADLMAMKFPPVRWIAERILPEGLTLFCGPPKFGKSWFILCLAVAVARGLEALGRLRTEGGKVLYLAHEDTPKRLQNRLRLILGNEAFPERLHLVTDWGRLHEGALGGIENFIEDHPDTKLIIVDTLQTVRSPRKGNTPVYEDDVATLTPLRELAGQRSISIVVIHHLRKEESDDPFDQISGSNGLAATSDTNWVVKRSKGKCAGEMFVRGREAEEQEYAIDFQDHRWVIEGDLSDFKYGDIRRDIVLALKASTEPLSKQEIRDALPNVDESYLSNLLYRMKRDGQINNPKKGFYGYVEPIQTCGSAG